MSTSLLSTGERKVAKAFIADMKAKGYKIAVWDGEAFALKASTDERAILSAMGSTGEDHLYVIDPERPKGERRIGWAFFVYGNSGSEVINDYTTNLTPLLIQTKTAENELEARGN